MVNLRRSHVASPSDRAYLVRARFPEHDHACDSIECHAVPTAALGRGRGRTFAGGDLGALGLLWNRSVFRDGARGVAGVLLRQLEAQ